MDEQLPPFNSGDIDPPVISVEKRYTDLVARNLNGRRALIDAALATLADRSEEIAEIAGRLVDTLRRGHKIMVAGNGGSATEAQHFASELMGRFQRERAPYAVLALTTDTAVLTAVANDYGYRQVFARQVLGLGQSGDLLLVFSTSGRSENILEAVTAASGLGMTTVALTSELPSPLEDLAGLTIRVPAVQTAPAQEIHMLLTHLLCDIVETELCSMERSDI